MHKKGILHGGNKKIYVLFGSNMFWILCVFIRTGTEWFVGRCHKII